MSTFYLFIDGSKGGVRDVHPPGLNSFNFVQFVGEFGKIICWRPLNGWRPQLGKTLDLPVFLAELLSAL